MIEKADRFQSAPWWAQPQARCSWDAGLARESPINSCARC